MHENCDCGFPNLNLDLAAERALLKDLRELERPAGVAASRRNVQADILEYESGETFLEAARKAPLLPHFWIFIWMA